MNNVFVKYWFHHCYTAFIVETRYIMVVLSGIWGLRTGTISDTASRATTELPHFILNQPCFRSVPLYEMMFDKTVSEYSLELRTGNWKWFQQPGLQNKNDFWRSSFIFEIVFGIGTLASIVRFENFGVEITICKWKRWSLFFSEIVVQKIRFHENLITDWQYPQ